MAVYDGLKKKLYIDGVMQSESDSDSIDVNNAPVRIGANAEHPSGTYNGSISEIKIYDTALTAEDVTELHTE